MYRVTALSRAAVAFASLTALPAFLASSPVHANGYDRPISWTGFYIGAHGSYNWADIEFPKAPPHPAGPPRQTLEGGFIGGQIGYNYQINRLVLGVEADISKGNITGSVRDGNYIVQTDTIDWTGSLRGRLGYAMGTFMPYLTAGWMWDRGTRGQSCPDPAGVVAGHCNAANGFSPYNLSQSQTHSGFVWGGGVEMMVGQHFSVKVEGLHFDMGDETYVLGPAKNGKTANTSVIEHSGSIFRIGGNYRF